MEEYREANEQVQEEGQGQPEPEVQEEQAEGADQAQQAAELEVPTLHPGDVTEGVIVQVNPDHLLVDVGHKADGMVPLSEMSLRPNQSPEENYEKGQKIRVQVLSIDGQEGGLILSERRAREAEAWETLEKAFEEGEVLEAPVTEQVKGGLVIDVGLRAFMPASHVERGYVNDLSAYVGQTVRAKIIELDRGKNRVILSQKVVLEEEHEGLRQKTWAELEEGQSVHGVVKGLTDFGAFVDLGGVDGLLHVSEMAWGRVNHPSEVLSVGDEIDVKVLRLDREKEKISLGLKQLLPDPWDDVEKKFPPGAILDGKVMRLAPFGAFVELEPGVEGLVHISQMADHHVVEPGEVVKEGDTVKVKVLRVQPDERRISLSIKEANRDLAPARRKKDKPAGGAGGGEPRRDAAVTLGDMFGDLFEETKERIAEDAAEAESAEAESAEAESAEAEAGAEAETPEAEAAAPAEEETASDPAEADTAEADEAAADDSEDDKEA